METMIESYGPELGFTAVVMLACGMIYLFVRSLIWAFRDAVARGKSGWLVVLLVAICKWPLSLLLWRVLRPPFIDQATSTGLDAKPGV